tara:strand:- start:322 stop:480 length:159 start_codon:yes stop_codon:yes gene_type:complete
MIPKIVWQTYRTHHIPNALILKCMIEMQSTGIDYRKRLAYGTGMVMKKMEGK